MKIYCYLCLKEPYQSASHDKAYLIAHITLDIYTPALRSNRRTD